MLDPTRFKTTKIFAAALALAAVLTFVAVLVLGGVSPG